MGGGGQRPVWHGNSPKKTGAGSARARTAWPKPTSREELSAVASGKWLCQWCNQLHELQTLCYMPGMKCSHQGHHCGKTWPQEYYTFIYCAELVHTEDTNTYRSNCGTLTKELAIQMLVLVSTMNLFVCTMNLLVCTVHLLTGWKEKNCHV
jgi:hypothetical protein